MPEFHFWDEPRDGYYGLSERPDILQRHGVMLRDASNTASSDLRSPDALVSIIEQFEKP